MPVYSLTYYSNIMSYNEATGVIVIKTRYAATSALTTQELQYIVKLQTSLSYCPPATVYAYKNTARTTLVTNTDASYMDPPVSTKVNTALTTTIKYNIDGPTAPPTMYMRAEIETWTTANITKDF